MHNSFILIKKMNLYSFYKQGKISFHIVTKFTPCKKSVINSLHVYEKKKKNNQIQKRKKLQ